MVKRDSSLQRTHFHCSRVQWRWALHHSSQRMVIFCLCVAAGPWKPISWNSQLTVWNSVVSYALQHSVSFLAYHFKTELLLLLAVSISQKQHFPSIGAALAQQDIYKLSWWKGGILWWCHVESNWALQYGPFYCQYLSIWIAWLCARLAEIAKSHTFGHVLDQQLKGWSHVIPSV
jgi:hypothetical protein